VQHALKAHPHLTLDVNEQNPAAQRFYEHLGFAVQGRSELDSQGRNYPLLHMKYGA
jgi:putative acetyltransferase